MREIRARNRNLETTLPTTLEKSSSNTLSPAFIENPVIQLTRYSQEGRSPTSLAMPKVPIAYTGLREDRKISLPTRSCHAYHDQRDHEWFLPRRRHQRQEKKIVQQLHEISINCQSTKHGYPKQIWRNFKRIQDMLKIEMKSKDLPAAWRNLTK